MAEVNPNKADWLLDTNDKRHTGPYKLTRNNDHYVWVHQAKAEFVNLSHVVSWGMFSWREEEKSD